MRSTFAGLNTMYRGIVANQVSLDTVGHNITNASTEGYSRQKVNQAATLSSTIYTTYGQKQLGTGTDVLSVMRARDVYADKQYWKESATNNYYTKKQTNYDKIEAIFNDSSDTGIEDAMEKFYATWVDLSANASTASNRTAVIEQSKIVIDRISTAATQLQEQVAAEYEDMQIHIGKINDIFDRVVNLNKNISTVEATGSYANDLRDERDLLTDELASYLSINVYEDNETGVYQIVSNGATLISGASCLHLELADRIANKTYGVTDFTLKLKETDTVFSPTDGILKAELSNIAEDKGYIDHLANISAFFLTTFNEQHRAGYGLDGAVTDPAKHNINFFGDENTVYSWDDTARAVVAASGGGSEELKGINIVKELQVNMQLLGVSGTNYVCAASAGGATADGSNAVLLSNLFNLSQDSCVNTTSPRSIGKISLEAYYNTTMSELGTSAEAMDNMVVSQEIIMTQVETWRSSTAGVNWNEELTNMIMFQQGYAACSRCLTTMDEMLDRLINSTGVVGR